MRREPVASALGDLADDEVVQLLVGVAAARDSYAARGGRTAPVFALMFGDFAALVAAERDRRVRDRDDIASALNPFRVVEVERPRG